MSWFHKFLQCLTLMSGDISSQLCFTVLTPAHEAQHSTADEQGIKKQMHWLIQSRTGKSIWWKTNLIIPRGILLLLVAKRLSPELPEGKTKFDTPAGKFHYDASEGFRWKQFLGVERGESISFKCFLECRDFTLEFCEIGKESSWEQKLPLLVEWCSHAESGVLALGPEQQSEGEVGQHRHCEPVT